ncbi:MAG: hypothetical protein SGI99_18240 [Pseudomonadota bacterium]|nr:hypothetical protein [Pseudomonadota bacterium]
MLCRPPTTRFVYRGLDGIPVELALKQSVHFRNLSPWPTDPAAAVLPTQLDAKSVQQRFGERFHDCQSDRISVD